jgi:ABC-type Na+ efflux pump permease subunit
VPGAKPSVSTTSGLLVTARPAKRLLSHGWLYIPAVSSPVGGGLIKLGHGSTWAAVAVGTAPYAICAMLYIVFVIGYFAALVRFLCAKSGGQEAMERLITVSANAIVSILTLSPAKLPTPARQSPTPSRTATELGHPAAGPRIAVQQRPDATRAPGHDGQA